MYFLIPLVSQKTRKNAQVTQNEYIRFYLKLNTRHQIGAKEFKETKWLPTKSGTTCYHKSF